SWLEGSALAEFELVRDSDSLLTAGALESQATKLLSALETAQAITHDANGVVRLRAGGSLPKRPPQTPTLAKLARTMRDALERAEEGAFAPPFANMLPSGKAKRA